MHFIEHQVAPRIENLYQLIPNVVCPTLEHIGSGAAGLVALPFATLIFGASWDLNTKADKTRHFSYIIPKAINGIAKVINPRFESIERCERLPYLESKKFREDVRSYGHNHESLSLTFHYTTASHFALGFLDMTIGRLAHPQDDGDSQSFSTFCKQHLATRALSLIFIPTAVVARVADFAIGLLLLTSQIYYMGSNQHLNKRMMHHLNVLAVVDDVARGVRGVFNPGPVFDLPKEARASANANDTSYSHRDSHWPTGHQYDEDSPYGY